MCVCVCVCPLSMQCKGRRNKLGQIREVLTPAQGYLTFFNNMDVTASPLVSLSSPINCISTKVIQETERPDALVPPGCVVVA